MSTTNTSRADSVRRGTPGAVAYTQRAEVSAPRQPLIYACELVLLVLGLAMAVLVARHPAPLPGDVGVALDVQHLLLPNKVVTQGLDAVSAINWPIPSAIAIVVAVVVLLVLHRRLAALITLVASGLADGSSFLTNEIVRRPRPSDHGLHVLQHITNYYSFPSGHVIHALAFYGFLVYVTFQVRRAAVWLWAIRVILVALIVLMPVSRVLEGEHWPSDVLEGLLYGTFWLILAIHAYGWAGRRWPRLRGGHDEQSGQEVPAPSSAGARQVQAGPVK